MLHEILSVGVKWALDISLPCVGSRTEGRKLMMGALEHSLRFIVPTTDVVQDIIKNNQVRAGLDFINQLIYPYKRIRNRFH